MAQSVIRQRITLRATHLKNQLRDAEAVLEDTAKVNEDEVPEKVEQLDGHVAKLKNATKNIEEDNHSWLDCIGKLKLADRDQAYAEYSEATLEGDSAIVPMIDQAKDAIELLLLRSKRLKSSRSKADENPSVSSTKKTAKLRNLEMPTFIGDSLRWNEFWSLFAANVDSEAYDKTVKLAYLRSYLRGPAFDAISGLDIADDSYDVAIQILKKRFEKTPEQLIGTLYSNLKALPRSTMKTKEIRRTHDSCEKIIRQLKSAGENISGNRTMVMDLLSKYPDAMIEEVTKLKKVDIRSTLEQTQKALGDHIDQLELIEGLKLEMKPFYQHTFEKPADIDFKRRREDDEEEDSKYRISLQHNKWKQKRRDNNGNFAEENRSSTLATTDARSANNRRPTRPCIFCSGEHFNSNCESYRTYTARKSRMDELNRCFRCQYSGHLSNDCKTAKFKINCYHCKARGKHWSPMCPTLFEKQNESSHVGVSRTKKDGDKKNKHTKKTTQESNNEDAEDSSVSTLSIEERSVLSTAVAVISNPDNGKKRKVKIILDNGSNRSYITEDAVRTLKLAHKNTTKLNLSTFGYEKSSVFNSKQVSFSLHLKNDEQMNIVANTTNLITNCSVNPSLSSSMMEEINAMKYALADDLENTNTPEVLIGSDYFWEIISGARIKTQSGLYYIPTTLGLVLGGRYSIARNGCSKIKEPNLLCIFEHRDHQSVQSFLTPCKLSSQKLDEETDIDDFWRLERMGICEDPTVKEDAAVLDKFKETIQFDGKRYQVQLPWKSNWNQLPTNYQLATGRLNSLVKRLSNSNEEVWQQYSKVIEQQLERGVIEKVTPEEVMGTSNIVHYVAHHPVIKTDSETTKCRIVYDASAKCGRKQPSLNDCLHRGPVILPDLCAILLRFRVGQIAITSDLQKAFLQVGLQPSQRDAFRFLWLRNPKEKTTANNVEIFRFTRVPFGSISSPFLLGATIVHHMTKIGTKTADKVKNNIYTDNIIITVPSVEEGIQFYNETKKIFEQAGMNLQQYQTNSNELHALIPKEDSCQGRITKVLGMMWNSEADCIQLQPKWKNNTKCTTKREILKVTASVFDPLGLFQPATLKLKLLLRDIWNSNLDWDKTLPEEMQQKWSELYEETSPIFNVKLSRKVAKLDDLENSTLVVFSDASAEAYGAAAYIRVLSGSQWNSKIIYAKSRLAPKVKWKAEVTIPRLELLGLTVAVKIGDFLRRALQAPHKMKLIVFCDSSSNLSWLRSSKKLDTFVENRVKLIRRTENAEFRFIKGENNPADIITRGLTGEELQRSELWWSGPDFLKLEKYAWPKQLDTLPVTSEELQIIEDAPCKETPLHHAALIKKSPREGPVRKKSFEDILPKPSSTERKQPNITSIAANTNEENADPLPFSIEPKRYSSLKKLLRVTAWCLMFLKKLWMSLSETQRRAHVKLDVLFGKMKNEHIICAEEMCTAKQLWIQRIQETQLKDIIDAIKKKKKHPMVSQLNLQVDTEDLIRCCGRLKHAELPPEAVEPVLLPKKNAFTELVVKEVHERQFHCGINHTLAELRRSVWIPAGRQVVKKVITRCQVCRKVRGPNYALPDMPAWPKQRVAEGKPFAFTGLDYFGPLNVKTADGTKKSWIVLFTCVTIRAIHMEVVSDFSAQAFLGALIRFVARRGTPEKIICDNAGQFKSVKKVLDSAWVEVLKNEAITSYLADRNIEWLWTTEFAPWQGGIYERLVGLVKNVLRSQLGRRLLQWDYLHTLIAEAEAVVNSRPITCIDSDISSGRPLRPCDFLCELPIGAPEIDLHRRPEGGEATKALIRHWKNRQIQLEKFWTKWKEDYLLNMRQYDDKRHPNSRSAVKMTPTIGEVVHVKNEDSPRGTWKLGRITKLISSGDGVVRSAELKIPNGAVLRRPLNHLYQLEIPAATNEAQDDADIEGFEGFGEEEVAEAEARRQAMNEHSGPVVDKRNEANFDRVLWSHARRMLSHGINEAAFRWQQRSMSQ